MIVRRRIISVNWAKEKDLNWEGKIIKRNSIEKRKANLIY